MFRVTQGVPDAAAVRHAVEDPGCGAVVVRETGSGWLTLMLRAYKNWDFPKGLCEDGEEPRQAKTAPGWRV